MACRPRCSSRLITTDEKWCLRLRAVHCHACIRPFLGLRLAHKLDPSSGRAGCLLFEARPPGESVAVRVSSSHGGYPWSLQRRTTPRADARDAPGDGARGSRRRNGALVQEQRRGQRRGRQCPVSSYPWTPGRRRSTSTLTAQVALDERRVDERALNGARAVLGAETIPTSARRRNVARNAFQKTGTRYRIPYPIAEATRAPCCPKTRKLDAEGLPTPMRLAPVGAEPTEDQRGVNVK